jgi:hypothetical protein
MIQWRPVDCDTRAPLPVSPGFIDRATIYRGGPRPGWSWQPYDSSAATLITPSAPAPSGAASTCLTISPTGGLPFRCRWRERVVVCARACVCARAMCGGWGGGRLCMPSRGCLLHQPA